MHAFHAPSGTVYSHNSDLSGSVSWSPKPGIWLEIPGEDIIALVAQYVRNQKIADLEEVGDSTILGLG